MSFPIKFKLVHKESGLTFNQWAKKNLGPGQYMPFLTEDGNIGYVDFDAWSPENKFLSPASWRLLLAITKQDGKWVYKQVGF